MMAQKHYQLIEDTSGKKALFKNKFKKNKNLVVFVHGFTGNYLSTWGDLPDLLTRDPRLQHHDFLFWGYSSNFIIPQEDFIKDNIIQLFTQFLSKHKTNQQIEVVAQGLQTELKYLDEYDNVTLIGHSLGGLVIRSYIIQNLKQGKKENLERINKIDQIILFGTPNEGLDVANNELLGNINNQIHDMGSYNEFINTLREDWIELVFKNKDLDLSTLMVAGEDDYFVPFEQVTKYFRDSRELTKGNHYTMIKPHTIHDTTYKIIANNLLRIEQKSFFELPDTDKVRSNKSAQSNELLEKIRKLIAERGLDDISWTQTLPAQYFLIRLARMLKLNKNADYLNLMDAFLRNYYMRVDNTIILSGDKGLDTPEELADIRNSMIEEDKKDDYFSRYSKSAAENIDIQLLHDTYHYGLMVQIASSDEFPESMTLRLIQDLAINSLIYGNGKKPTNDHGGWYPQRLPWLTARVLIGLKNSGYEMRDDKEHIDETVSQAIDYLMRSIYQDSYWRSGIGDWVTDWEATAVCLEALDQWGKIKDHEQKIKRIIDYVLEKEQEWLVPSSFDTKNSTNRTLAAVTLLCTVIIIINKYFKKSYDLDHEKYFAYLSKALDQITESSKIEFKQYSTIHQIAFYIARMALTLDNSLLKKSTTFSGEFLESYKR
jgi:uncharacterized alpha/beta hydrolase family protein